MLGALATSHKIGILIAGGAFITFALSSSFLLPARWPGFPGKRLRLFVGVCVLFTVAMLGTILALAKEPKEERAASTAPATTAPPPPASTTAPAAPAGDPAAGKTVFSGAGGCSSCHTFKPAGSTAKIGPDLDNLAADAQKANRGSLVQYTTESIKDPAAYVVPGYPNGVMPPNFGTQLGDKKIADLVAFLTSKSG